ncbi:hypothetical protein IVB22_05195 [Bradyrhizobium sp. 190]|uniref:hypothetical protein n=1 Tax=Bradyrhizobium sp. 190 TaxID=2782658 RepID=UPI001FF86D61|nr:hypothetical protein [Bradyrhizobium sp. 190]MCK1511970.1 hypothetical protein [Bradyrhizobium sp. 190]
MRYVTIDGMLSGTGIRDSLTGEYLDLNEVGLSPELVRRIEKWVIDYETAHYGQFNDEVENQRLDQDGIEIARQAQSQLPEMKVAYFSNAQMKKIGFK